MGYIYPIMRFLYVTSFRKTSGLANRFQVMSMAKAFLATLKENFFFGAASFEDPKNQIRVFNFGEVKSYFLAFRVIKFCRKNKITHIFCREPRLLFFIIVWNMLFFRLKIKTIYEIHELVSNGFQRKFFERFLAGRVDLNIMLTKYMAEEYAKKYHLPPEKIMVASDAVDLSIFDIPAGKEEMRKKYNLPLDKKIIGYFGRFKTMGMDKGITDTLKALKNLPEDIVFLAQGGKQRDRDEYQAQALELGVSGRVIFVEHFDQSILAEYQKAADILLMPFPWQKHFAYYASPLKMFEYMAAKRPVIATDLPSTREVLDGSTAVFVPPGDPEKLALAVKTLLADPQKQENLVKAAFEKVQNYTWEKRVNRILEQVKIL